MRIEGGVAGNVIPDRCVVTVNYRFAPSKDVADAEKHLRELFTGYDVVVTDAASGARPGLDRPDGPAFVAGHRRRARRRSTAGPTSPASASSACPPSTSARATRLKAHADDEYVNGEEVRRCLQALTAWLA